MSDRPRVMIYLPKEKENEYHPGILLGYFDAQSSIVRFRNDGCSFRAKKEVEHPK